MHRAARYFRLLFAFGRYSLAREMAFRGNFLVKVFVEVLWLTILLIFYRTVFTKTSVVADWTETQYLFFVGCYFALEGLIETLFLENCNEFSNLIRTGDLDLYLLKPIDEQFLVTLRKIDWTTAPNILVGIGVMIGGLSQLPDWRFDLASLLLFVGVFVCGVAMAYSFLVMLMATAVWLVRNQSLMELWWLFTTLMRYPRELYTGKEAPSFARPLGIFFSFVVPVLLVIYVPARTLLQMFDAQFLAIMCAATVALLWLSRRFFRRALQSYRSASS